MNALTQLAEDHAIELPAADPTIERVRAGDVFVALTEDRVEIRAATLAAILEQLAGDPVKLVWAGNPLRSPLTIERLILQAGGPEADLRFDRTPEQLVRMLAPCTAPDTGRLIIVQQPETLDPIARETLARMAPHLAAASPRIQFLFCGTSAFQPIEPLPPERPAGTAVALRAPDRSLPPNTLPEPPPTSSRRGAVPLLLLLALTSAGSFLPTQIAPSEPASEAPRPIALQTISPQSTASPAPQRATTEMVVDVAALRREFDLFLAQQHNRVSTLTPDQRNALFQEYLGRSQRPPPPTPAKDPT